MSIFCDVVNSFSESICVELKGTLPDGDLPDDCGRFAVLLFSFGPADDVLPTPDHLLMEAWRAALSSSVMEGTGAAHGTGGGGGDEAIVGNVDTFFAAIRCSIIFSNGLSDDIGL